MFLFSYPVYSQIWLNYFVNDHQFSYITLKRKALVLTSGTHHNIHVAFFVWGNMLKTLNNTGLSSTLPNNILSGARARSFHHMKLWNGRFWSLLWVIMITISGRLCQIMWWRKWHNFPHPQTPNWFFFFFFLGVGLSPST